MTQRFKRKGGYLSHTSLLKNSCDEEVAETSSLYSEYLVGSKFLYKLNSNRLSGSLDGIDLDENRSSFIKAGLHSFRRKTSTWRRHKRTKTDENSSSHLIKIPKQLDHNRLNETDACLSSDNDSTSSARSYRIRFWLNSYHGKDNSSNEESQDTHFSRSTKLDAIVYQCPPRHRIRFWLNEKNPYGYSDSILEVRHSEITTRIIRARVLADIAAVEAAKMGEYRRKVRAAKYAGAAAAAAFARLAQARKDVNASHGSIANAAMFGYRAVAAAAVIPTQQNADFGKLQEIFYEHFKYRKEPGYFRRLKSFSIRDLDKNSTEYKMYLRLRAIPVPPMNCDLLKFHSDRFDQISAESAKKWSEINAKRDAV